jgi:hypothetical protein
MRGSVSSNNLLYLAYKALGILGKEFTKGRAISDPAWFYLSG